MAASTTIRLVEGDDKVQWTLTAKRAGTAIGLTGKTVKIMVHLNGQPDDTNLVDFLACTLADEDNGVVTYDFLSTQLASAGRGRWRLQITTTATSAIEHLKAGLFIIERNSGEA